MAEAPRPNVVFIVSDDQHWRDYAFMGHPHLRTPHLDRLARESLVFPRGYVTSSLCCPSLATIITGRYPHEHRVVGNDPPGGKDAFEAGRERMNRYLEECPALPRMLAAQGYGSFQTGKWWQGDFSRGGFTEGMTKGKRHGDEGLSIGRQTMQPIYDFIGRSRAAGKPFFVWYAPMLPHDPHDPAPDFVEHYRAKTDSVHVARYLGNVERFDRTVGDLLDHLDREQLSANTLVIFITDNGWIQSPDSPRFAPRSKLSPYDGGLRTPIMLRQLGTIRPGTSEALASAVDVVPTVLAACGIAAPPGLPGVNLLDAQAVAARRQVFGECYTHTLVDLDDPAKSLLWRWTVRDRWKLIVPATAGSAQGFPEHEGRLVDPDSKARHERGEVELFDVVADPDETTNLAAAQPAIVTTLRASLDAWWNPAIEQPPAATDREAVRDGASTAWHRPPSVVVFLADDLGAHDLGCTGSTSHRSPAIDRLAADGMLFTRGYAAAPVCSPTRAALVTTLDIAATILDAAGAPSRDDAPLDGASLRPVLAGTGTPGPRDLVWRYPHYSNRGVGRRPRSSPTPGQAATRSWSISKPGRSNSSISRVIRANGTISPANGPNGLRNFGPGFMPGGSRWGRRCPRRSPSPSSHSAPPQ